MNEKFDRRKDYLFGLAMDKKRNLSSEQLAIVHKLVGGEFSTAQISTELNIKPSNVTAILKNLKQKDLLLIQRKGDGKSYLYSILIPD